MGGRQLAQFYHELATLMDAGVPLSRALEGLGRKSAAVAGLARRLGAAVGAGGSLSEAAAAYGAPFTPMQMSLLAAGEQSGRLPEQMLKLAETLDAQRKQRQTLIASLLYPLILLHFGAGLRALVALFNESAPAAARWLLLCLGPLYAVALAVLLLFTVGRRLDAVDAALDWLLWHVPVLAGINRNLALARFARTFGALAGAGISARQTLRMAANASGNRVMQHRLRRAVAPIEQGENLGQSLIATGAFTPDLESMLQTGAEGGRLPEMMDHITRKAEHDAAHALKILNIILPILVFLVVVGFIVFTIIDMLGDYWRMVMEALGE